MRYDGMRLCAVTQVDFELRILGLLLFAIFVKAAEGNL